LGACIVAELDFGKDLKQSIAMKGKRRLLTREELLDLEDKYFPGTLGNLLSLGAAHFRQTKRRNTQPPSRASNGPSHRRSGKPAAA
jgi:hypothetical protein